MSEQVMPGGGQPGGEERGRGGPGGGGGRRRERGGRDRGPRQAEVYFDPGRSEAELVDDLAQRQARGIRRISAPELAKFWVQIQELRRAVERAGAADAWHRSIEPQVKLLRSQAFYANRRIGQGHGVPREFRDFIDKSVQTIRSQDDFVKFARHFEAVVGFLYGMGAVQS